MSLQLYINPLLLACPTCVQVRYDKKFDPGYQGAYGIIAEVGGQPHRE